MTNLEHVDMHSSRNQVVLGSSVLLGLMVPLYLKSTPGAIKTGEKIKVLPPANDRLREGNVFTPFCHSANRGPVCLGASIIRVSQCRGSLYTVAASVRVAPSMVTSGQYTSYWNTSLVKCRFLEDYSPLLQEHSLGWRYNVVNESFVISFK